MASRAKDNKRHFYCKPFLFGSGPELLEAISGFGLRYNKLLWGQKLGQDPLSSNCLILCGPLSDIDCLYASQIWSEMKEEKTLIAFGAHAFSSLNESKQSLQKKLLSDIDYFVPGAPAAQESLLEVLVEIENSHIEVESQGVES